MNEVHRKLENIVINSPLLSPEYMFASSHEDWINVEQNKTYYTEETFLPKIMVEICIVKSINEIRRNKPDLLISLDKYDYIEIKRKEKIIYTSRRKVIDNIIIK